MNDYSQKREKIIGTCYDKKSKKWTQKKCPLPDVLYNRCAVESKLNIKKMNKMLKRFNIPLVNAKSFFNKWETHQSLSLLPQVKNHLPDTQIYKTKEDLQKFILKHNEVYLKGVRGGGGRWVFRIQKKADGPYEYSYFVKEQVNGSVASWDEFIQKVHQFFGMRSFIMQESIQLIKVFSDHIVDFRAELQRNDNEQIEIVGICARVGRSKAPITIHSSAIAIEVFLKDFLNYSHDDIQESINRIHPFLIKMYEAIESQYGRFGEIGLDFGVDYKGHLWLIEANAKSAKVSLMKAYDKDTVHRSFVTLLKFSNDVYKKNSEGGQ